MAEHGIQITRTDITPPPVPIVGQGLIGVVGTAPAAKVDGKFGDGTNVKYDEPFFLTARSDAPEADLGDKGTLPAVLNGIYRQGDVAVQMVITKVGQAVAQIDSKDLAASTFSTFTSQSGLDAATTLTGAHWALIHEGDHRFLAIKNIANADVTILQGLKHGRQITVSASGGSVLKTYTVEGTYDATYKRIEVNRSADTHTLTTGTNYDLATVTVSAQSADAGTRINLLGRESQLSGIYALTVADPKPTLLCLGNAFANTRVSNRANILAAGLVEIAKQMGAIAVLDGPNTTQAAALTFAGDFDSPRAFLVDPGIVTADGPVLASPSVAGLMAVTDFWRSPSNRVLEGVVGLGRRMDKKRAQALNTKYIATVIRKAGHRLWGNETVTTTDPNFRFLNIQRTADAIEVSLREAHKWAVDRLITTRYFELVSQSVNNFLDKLTSQDIISGGVCYPDRAKNTASTIQEGQVFFNVEWSGAYPAQTLNIDIQLSGRFLEELLKEVL